MLGPDSVIERIVNPLNHRPSPECYFLRHQPKPRCLKMWRNFHCSTLKELRKARIIIKGLSAPTPPSLLLEINDELASPRGRCRLRCCSPPERVIGAAFSLFSSPTLSSAVHAAGKISLYPMPGDHQRQHHVIEDSGAVTAAGGPEDLSHLAPVVGNLAVLQAGEAAVVDVHLARWSVPAGQSV